MEKAWEQVWVKACDDALDYGKPALEQAEEQPDRENLTKVPGGYKEARQDYDDMMARQVHNSPPPLDDVGGDVTDILDKDDPTLAFLLNERKKTHGDYPVHANITQALKDVMRIMPGWHLLTDCQKETLEMITHKIGRILAGNADYPDHWDDIAGYAKLVSLHIATYRQE